MIYLAGWGKNHSLGLLERFQYFFKKEYTVLRKSGTGVRSQRARSSHKKYSLNWLQKRVNADKERMLG